MTQEQQDPTTPTSTPPPAGGRRHFHNWMSLAGFIIALGSLFAFVLLFAIDLIAHHGNPYMGILAYVVAPGFLFLGLFLVALGAWMHRRHHRKTAATPTPHVLTIDLSRARDRKVLAGFAAGTVLFLFLTALGSYHTYHYTESVVFCGQACHVPMKPEAMAYGNSPHARVACVECHVGSGPGAYVKAKINGVHQLCSMINNSFERPIKTPVANMRSASETCAECHWPHRAVGDVERTYRHFLADDTNTAFSVRMVLHVGGGLPDERTTVKGIHAHNNYQNSFEYIATDPRRQVIPWVRFQDHDGNVTEYRTEDFQGNPEEHEIRRMDCVDCHNRPAHRFHAPNEAVDKLIARGSIDATMKWVKSNAVFALTQPYATENEGLEGIDTYLRTQYPSDPRLDYLIRDTQDIFLLNIFPEMKTDWRAHPDNLGHKHSAGCFRCHDGRHKDHRGNVLKASDCNSCHTIIAQGIGAEIDKVDTKGLTFVHIDAEYTEANCIDCHTGSFPKQADSTAFR